MNVIAFVTLYDCIQRKTWNHIVLQANDTVFKVKYNYLGNIDRVLDEASLTHVIKLELPLNNIRPPLI